MKFIALGRTKWLYDAVLKLHEHGHKCILIATASASPEYAVKEEGFLRLAQKLGCEFCCNIATIELAERTNAMDIDVGISVNWPTLIPPQLFSQPKFGILNAHTGDLPRYRGNACPNWAIINKESRATVTIHQMDKGFDSGPVLLKRHMDITDHTYIFDLYAFMDTNIPDMFASAVAGLADGSIVPTQQPSDPSYAFRCFPRIPSDSRIDWARTADDIARLVRASAEPFRGAYTTLHGERLTIWRSHADQLPYAWSGMPGHVALLRQTGEAVVLCGKGVLVVQTVGLGGRRFERASAVLRSTRTRLGFVE